MNPTYISEQLLTTNLFVNASQVNKNIDDVIKNNLKEQLEGLCYEDGYIVKDSVKIISKSMGKIVVNDNVSSVSYSIKYRAKVISPTEGDIIESYVSNINKMGIVSYIKLSEGDSSEESPMVIMVPKDYFDMSIHHLDDINIGQKLTVLVVGSRIKYRSEKIQIIAKLNE
jgi:DNA-directed RNA polymerase subunit E'/Rpb7|tara:strand:+ start:1242 stop:1751 length:510 start_codon:yes stop_codon:yes gene_type:complete